ncbi:MAG TPA: hypothetical protein VH500_24390, partial [Nitrososphaeraceae archaeon]
MSRQTKRIQKQNLSRNRNTRHNTRRITARTTSTTILKSISSKQLAYYGEGISYLEDKEMKGRLIVIEGPDSSGRSTQITMITSKLEADGHAVLNTGLRRSELIGAGILEAKRNFVLGKRTLSLFYAADVADQLENKIIPALRSGYIVLA